MKYIKIIVAVLFYAVAASCSRGPDSIKGAWCDPTNGLQVALQVSRAQNKSKTEILIMAVFKNRSDTPQKLMVNPYMTINLSHNGKPFADAIGNAEISEDEPYLQPGEERAVRLTGLRTDICGAGVYSIGGRIGGMELVKIEIKVK